MWSNLIKKCNSSVTLFLPLKNTISLEHVKHFQNFGWKNLAVDPKKRFATPIIDNKNKNSKLLILL